MEMRPCRKCSNLISDAASQCRYCGQATSEPSASSAATLSSAGARPVPTAAPLQAQPVVAPFQGASPAQASLTQTPATIHLADAAPVSELVIDESPGSVVLRWRGGDGLDVKVYRLRSQPTWAKGALLSHDVVRGMGAALPPRLVGEAEDPSPFHGISYYLAVSTHGSQLIAGPVTRHVYAADVSDLRAEERPHEVLVLWQWPDACARVALAWRPDGYPTDAADPCASRREITQGEYGAAGGFRLPKKPGSYYFRAFAILESEGHRLVAKGNTEGAKDFLRIPIVLRYSITAQGFFRKRYVVSLTADEVLPLLPEIAVMCKSGGGQPLQPLNASEGLMAWKGAGKSAGPLATELGTFELDCPRPAYLRAFFTDPDNYESYSLQEPHLSQLKLKR